MVWEYISLLQNINKIIMESYYLYSSKHPFQHNVHIDAILSLLSSYLL